MGFHLLGLVSNVFLYSEFQMNMKTYSYPDISCPVFQKLYGDVFQIKTWIVCSILSEYTSVEQFMNTTSDMRGPTQWGYNLQPVLWEDLPNGDSIENFTRLKYLAIQYPVECGCNLLTFFSLSMCCPIIGRVRFPHQRWCLLFTNWNMSKLYIFLSWALWNSVFSYPWEHLSTCFRLY